MTVKDLKEGMRCTIISARKDKKYEARKVIRMIIGNYVYVDVTVYDGKVVNLNGVSNYLSIDIENNEPQVFQYVFPEICHKSGKKYYRIDLKHKYSVKYNRRHNFRVPVGKSVSVRIDKNIEPVAGMLRDISAVGFALEIKKQNLPPDYKNSKSFHCVFTDMDVRTRLKATLDLKGIARRMVDISPEKVLVGCAMSYSTAVDKYVAGKVEQMKRGW